MSTNIPTKKCQLCKFTSYYCYYSPDNNNVCCPVCVDNICDKFYSCDTLHYNYCSSCKIIFRYNDVNIHHNLYSSGYLYYAELISKFTAFNNTFDFCPLFVDFNEDKQKEFIELYKKGDIMIEWVKHINIEECCVCFENTCHNTECSHPVCLDCLKTLKKCPICRHNLQYKNTIYQNTIYQNTLIERVEDDELPELIYDGGPGSYPDDEGVSESEDLLNTSYYDNVD